MHAKQLQCGFLFHLDLWKRRLSRFDVSHMAPLGHALSASVLLVLFPLGGNVIDAGL